MQTLKTEEIKELLNKCWMTHDGMWFYHCLNELGIETTNRLNKAASRSLAAVEIKRVMQVCGLSGVSSFAEFKTLFEGAVHLLTADFMDFDYEFREPDLLQCRMGKRCFALAGMRRLGVEREYECGIFHRVEGWFEALGLKFSVSPEVLKCMMLDEGRCFRDYRFDFSGEA